MTFVVATFYHFFDFTEYISMRSTLTNALVARQVKGTLLVAPEGINATVAGTRDAIDGLLAYLQKDIIRAEFPHKESLCDRQPFQRTKVRIKKETISLGEPTSLSNVGEYVEANEWNALISRSDVLVIDTRNDYEVHLGSFEGAYDPDIHTFKELPANMRETLKLNGKTKIATFCTGGIRCEKFTSWLRGEGFEEVYHLKGGILAYLEEVPEAESKWQGECFVFDERIAVRHKLVPSKTASMCKACGYTVTADEKAHPHYMQDLHCPNCYAGTI